jgi:hypothetical protein
MLEHHRERLLNSYTAWAEDPKREEEVGSWFEYLGVLTILVLGYPTLHAVSHSMSVWPRSSKNGGKLPFSQLVGVGLLGTLFQGVCLYSPIITYKIFRYLLYAFIRNTKLGWIRRMGAWGTAIQIGSLLLPLLFPFLVKACLRYFNTDMYRVLLSVHGWAMWLWDITEQGKENLLSLLRVEWEYQAEFWRPIFRRNEYGR